MSHPDLGNSVFDGYYRFDGINGWGNNNFNYGNVAYITRQLESDTYLFRLMVHDENNDAEIEMARGESASPDFPTGMDAIGGTLVSGSLTFNTEQRESYGVRIISGTVTANPTGTQTIAGSVTLGAGTNQIGSVTASISGTVPISISSVTVGNSVTIGSLPAISGTVTANLSISSTAITSGSFTSLTSATLVPANPARKMATVYNLGAGQLFVNAGATATTLGGGFMVALSSGDFYECDYTTTTLSAIFATAGTASWVSH